MHVIGTFELRQPPSKGLSLFYTLCDVTRKRIMSRRVSKNGGSRGIMKKNGWILFVFIFLGLLAGTLVAIWLKEVPGLTFLTRPIELEWSPAADLSVISYSLDLNVDFSLLSLIGAIVAIWLYRKV